MDVNHGLLRTKNIDIWKVLKFGCGNKRLGKIDCLREKWVNVGENVRV